MSDVVAEAVADARVDDNDDDMSEEEVVVVKEVVVVVVCGEGMKEAVEEEAGIETDDATADVDLQIV